MKKERNTLIRWFCWWGWDPDKVEAWLEAMAAEGWRLVKADRLLLRFHFRRDEPKKVRICTDYPGNVTPEYRTLFEDAGWELVGEGMGWYIWRTEYSGAERPEIFNGVDELIERSQRLLLLFVTVLLGQLPFWILNANRRLIEFTTTASKVFLVFYAVLILVIVFAAVATSSQIVRLKARKR